jgi:hypothetical protein
MRWVYAWSADFVAMAVTLVFWYLQSRSNGAGPAPPAWRLLVRVLYVGSKTLFLLMLLRGTWTLRGRTLWLLQPLHGRRADGVHDRQLPRADLGRPGRHRPRSPRW